MNLILDENLPPRWRDYLAMQGITSAHWPDIGNFGAAAAAIFDYAWFGMTCQSLSSHPLPLSPY